MSNITATMIKGPLEPSLTQRASKFFILRSTGFFETSWSLCAPHGGFSVSRNVVNEMHPCECLTVPEFGWKLPLPSAKQLKKIGSGHRVSVDARSTSATAYTPDGATSHHTAAPCGERVSWKQLGEIFETGFAVLIHKGR
jgi:hypothetical protein